MLPHVKVLDIAFTTVFTTDFKNFGAVKQIYQLTICRLSDIMATFVHGYYSFVAETKITKRLNLPLGDSAYLFVLSESFSGQ